MSCSVRDLALAAHEAERELQRATWEAAQADRAARDLEADEQALAMVRQQPWIRHNLPDVEWELVTRRFPQNSACVHPVGEPNIWLVVTEHRDYVQLSPGTDRDRPLVGSQLVRTVADLGAALVAADGRRRQEASANEWIQP